MRISATLLESFRLYLTADWYEESDLIAHIKGEYVERPEMKLGRSYHALIEKPQRSLSGLYEHDGLVFDDACIDHLLNRIAPGGLFEVKTTKEIMVPRYGPVTLVTKVDHVYGATIDEFKTTLDAFDSEKYLPSMQWRIMALLFEASLITYHVALLKQEDDRFILRSLESMNCYPYPAMERDVLELVKEFCSYVKFRGLESYLEPKVQAEAR